MGNNGCKAIMYHYVRDDLGSFPNLKYLHLEDFQKQLDFFEREYGFVKKEDWLNFIEFGGNPPSGILMTFDDGLKDHYEFVLPVLEKRGLWGMFFVCSLPLQKKEVLDVHKIHYLLGKYDSGEVYKKLIDILTSADIPLSSLWLDGIGAYGDRIIDSASMAVRKINYLNDERLRKHLTKALFGYFCQSEAEISEDIYMSADQVMALEKAGHIIGGHSESHRLLPRLSDMEFARETIQSNEALREILWIKIECFCYPFWWSDSYDERSILELERSGVKYAFRVEPMDISKQDTATGFYELPRYDCNLFKFGMPRSF